MATAKSSRAQSVYQLLQSAANVLTSPPSSDPVIEHFSNSGVLGTKCSAGTVRSHGRSSYE
eukprot:14963232-Alexandrium_andersonii.AAC.1